MNLTYPQFDPGSGGTPPYLAGREAEQQALRKPLLERLYKGKGTGRDIILIGPRGNGKTALMHWLERTCEQDSILDVVWLTPASVRNDLDALANELAPLAGWRERLQPDIVRAGITGVGATWKLGNRGSSLSHLLLARCRQRPLVVLLDEAHTLDTELGRVLLNVSQEVRARSPFLLVLAGTPGLEQKFNDMDVTFWTRSMKLGLDRLDASNAGAALVEPFRTHGIDVAVGALQHVVADSQGYPYFLQCWGEALTERLCALEEANGKALRHITETMVTATQPQVDAVRTEHYESFRGQIYKAGLQPLAAAITEAHAGADSLAEHELHSVVRAYLKEVGKPEDDATIATLTESLAQFGYVWRPPAAKAIWHAGIPSLMTHVLEVERKVDRGWN